jgi:hypothetical protein
MLSRGMRASFENLKNMFHRRNSFVEDTGLTTLQEVEQNLTFPYAKDPTDFLPYSTPASIEVEENSVVTLMSRDLSL